MAGLYVMLPVPLPVARTLAVAGGEAAETLHVTLAYLGEQPPEGEQLARTVIEGLAALTPPVNATISGSGRFIQPSGDCLYASVDSAELSRLRERIVQALERHRLDVDETHGFTPHISLASVPTGGDEVAVAPLSFTFSAIGVKREGELLRSEIALGAVAKTSTPADALCQDCGKRHPLGKDCWLLHKELVEPPDLRLMVHGVQSTPDGKRVYRMQTRDGSYVGMTNPTSHRAVKGDILVVKANHLRPGPSGDILWANAHVGGKAMGRAHSRRELEAFAGQRLVKDEPATSSGPTAGSVHVNSPLKRLSVFYGNVEKAYEVHKADAMKQLAYGIVLEPHLEDSQGDVMRPEEVEATAHRFLKKSIRGQAAVHKLRHRAVGFKLTRPSIVPVESFIAPVDFSYDGQQTIRKGAWVLVAHVEDKALWQDFLDGKYTGWSVGGSGLRRSLADGAVLPAATR